MIDTRAYRIVEHGSPNWYIVRDLDRGMVRVRSTTMRYDDPGHPLHGQLAELNVPRWHLIPVPTGASAGEAALPVARPAPGAESTPAPLSPPVQGVTSPVVGPPAATGDTIRGARRTDPATSLEAAMSVTDLARRTVYTAILDSIREHGPLTDWQLAKYVSLRTGVPIIPTSAGVRRGELRNMGLLADSGHRGPTETGPRKGIRWALTPAGEREAAA